MASTTALIAHQGGWDEILLVAGPVVVIVVALSLARRRVDRLERNVTSGSDVPGDTEKRHSGSDVPGDTEKRHSGSDVPGDTEKRHSGSGVAGDAEERGVTGDHLTRVRRANPSARAVKVTHSAPTRECGQQTQGYSSS